MITLEGVPETRRGCSACRRPRRCLSACRRPRWEHDGTRMFAKLSEAGGPIDNIGNDAGQLVVSVDDAPQLLAGLDDASRHVDSLGEGPTTRACFPN